MLLIQDIIDIIDIIKNDKVLYDLISESEIVKTHEGPIQSLKTLNKFWNSLDGIKFKSILQSKHGVTLSTQQRSSIKDALLITMHNISIDREKGVD